MPEEPRNYEPTPEIETQQAPNLENLEIDLFELTSSTSEAKKGNGEINSMYTVFYPTSEEGKGVLAFWHSPFRLFYGKIRSV